MIMFHHDDEPGASVRSGTLRGVGLVVEDGALARRVLGQELVAHAEARIWAAADAVQKRNGLCGVGEVAGDQGGGGGGVVVGAWDARLVVGARQAGRRRTAASLRARAPLRETRWSRC